jgi:uncharacterized protein (DUF58 family)
MGAFSFTRWRQEKSAGVSASIYQPRRQPGRGPDRVDRAAWRTFFLAMAELGFALLLALSSTAAAQSGKVAFAWITATGALVVAAWVMFTLVPALARRTPLRWLAYRIDYRVTKEGIVYLGGVFVVALAALNTGNNLLFMVLACLLAGILISGIISQLVLSGIELRMVLPEHIFAGRPVLALVEFINHKQSLPSFSLQLVGAVGRSREGAKPGNEILTTPVYFPYVPRQQTVQQNIELRFATRGIYRQELLGLRTRFPFGFLEKTRRVASGIEAVVYPAVEPAGELAEILPLVAGELESFLRGRGQDLYAIRDFQSSDSARHVDWKASAKTGVLQVREFTRDDDRRVLLALDPFVPPSLDSGIAGGAPDPLFERGVGLCASLAWHFHQLDSVLAFRSGEFETPMGPASESIFAILRHLAGAAPLPVRSGRSFLDELATEPDIFKIILTRRSRGAIPAGLWSSSYILFLGE